MISSADVLAKFPFKTLRNIQGSAIQETCKHFESGKKIVVLELPAGVGKSAVAMAFAKAYSRTYLITVQKMLQDQYEREFGEDVAVLKGRNAYDCITEEGGSCATGPCQVDSTIRQGHIDDCPYLLAVKAALAHKTALLNMDSFYYQSMYGWFAGEKGRDLMIVDEGHLIEDKFLGFIEVKLQQRLLPMEIPHLSRTVEYVPFLRRCSEALTKQVEEFQEKPEISKVEVLRFARIESLLRKIDNVLVLLPAKPDGWVHQFDFDRNNEEVLTIRPVFVGEYVRDQLFTRADRIIVMSATIISIKHWCESVGLKRDEVAFVRSDSPFPVKNRQIVLRYAGSLSRKNVEKSLPGVMRELRTILEEHKGERGIVHTHSYKLEKAIRQSIPSRRLTYKNGNVPAMLEEHARKPDSVIVGPGLAEGLDLIDDLARFAVLLKVPYPSLGDAQVRRRFDLDKSWYNFRTAMTLVQEYGRTVRHDEDHATTYVLDTDFERFRKMAKSMLPPWFTDAVVRWEDWEG